MDSHVVVPAILPLHVVAGGLALVFGYTALCAAKGATLHRRSGMLFVCAMVVMSILGALVAALATSGISVSVVAGLLTFYLVTTGLLTVRVRPQQSRRMDTAAVLFALTVAILAFRSGFDMLNSGRPETIPCFLFGIVGLLAAAGDLRMIRARTIQGPRRIARHLWRMCFAMWIAAASFFWGPPDRVPEALRIPVLQAGAVLVPIVAMLYWLWRIRVRRTFRGNVGITAPQITAGPSQ
jgi:uncharacterized membrane protein